MADLNLTELRKVAEAATPGPWEADRFWWKIGSTRGLADGWWRSVEGDGDVKGSLAYLPDDGEPDARHIAAFDPPTVLALLDRVAELVAELAEEERQHAKSLSIMEEALDQRDEARAKVARVEALLRSRQPRVSAFALREALAGEADE